MKSKVKNQDQDPMMDEDNTEKIYQSIINEAPYIPGDNGDIFEFKDIPWIDPELIREGQEFVRRNHFAVNLAHISALLYGFSFKPLTTVLLRTGGFGLGDATQSMIRHVDTGIHIKKWYESDMFGDMSEGYKDVQFVRKLHVHALRKSERTPVVLHDDVPNKSEKLAIIDALKKDLDDCVDTSDAPTDLFTYHPKVFMNQYDMLMTQFGFISLIFLFPRTLGIRENKGIAGFLHLWAVLGKMLGIEDRFNLALNPNRELCLKLFYKLGMASMKDMDITILHLQQTYIDAISPLFKFITLKSVFYSGLLCREALPNFKGRHMYPLLSWRDKIFVYLTMITSFLIYHFDFARVIANNVYRYINDRNEENVLEKQNKSIKKKEMKKMAPAEFLKRIWNMFLPAITLIMQRTK